MARLVWRRTPNERGLAAVGQSPRGFEGRIDGKVVLNVQASGGSWRGPLKGWFWYGLGQNTVISKPLFGTAEEARDDAKKFYKSTTTGGLST